MESLQQHTGRLYRTKKARALANLLLVFRSAAQFYPTKEGRRAAVERLLSDVRFDDVVRAATSTRSSPLLVGAKNAVIQFCLGHIGVNGLKNRLQTEPTTGGDGAGDVVGSESARSTEGFWSTLCDQLESLLNNSANNASDQGEEDVYDARIEFARQFNVDVQTRLGIAGLVREQRSTGGNLVSYDECILTLASFGHLNRPVVFESVASSTDSVVGETNEDNIEYTDRGSNRPTCVFGSNYVWFRSDALFTLAQRDQDKHPPAFENDSQIATFVESLVSLTGVVFEPDLESCRETASRRNGPAITSMSNNAVSLQFTFAMPDSNFYTANVFYTKGGNTCSTDFRYKRLYLSNACRCENRLSYWRVCVSVTVLDSSGDNDASNSGSSGGGGGGVCERDGNRCCTLGALVGTGLSDFVTDVFRAFQRAKDDQGAHFFIDQFTGLALINYTDDSIELGGTKTNVNIATAEFDDSSEPAVAFTCDMHRWLRAHQDPTLWRSLVTAGHGITDVLASSHGPQLLVVRRPLISRLADSSHGPDIFSRYKTFDDLVSKHLLLTLDTVRRGFGEHGATSVAYESADGYWVCGTPTPAGGATGTRWLDTAPPGDLAATTSSGSDTELLWLRRVFSAAPARLYVSAALLSKLGFAVTGTVNNDGNVESSSRTFTHTDPDTTNSCTVVCSAPLVVIDEVTKRPLETVRDETTPPGRSLLLLKHPHGPATRGSVLNMYRETSAEPDAADETVFRRFRKNVTSLNDFWPGVQAVRISFLDTALENVHFVFFTSLDGSEAVQRLTRDGLDRLSRHNMKSSFQLLPPPVVYTLQQMYLDIARSADPVDPRRLP